MDMDHSKYEIKEEPFDFEERKGDTLEHICDPLSQDNTQAPDLFSVKTEETVEIGKVFISLIKADVEVNTFNVSGFHQTDPLATEDDKINEEKQSIPDTQRWSVHQIRKRGPGIDKLNYAKEKCPHCDKLVVSSLLSNYVGVVHRPFVCDICDKGFAKKTILRKHKSTVHVNKSQDKRFKWKCDYCETRYRCKSRLDRHCRNMHKIFL